MFDSSIDFTDSAILLMHKLVALVKLELGIDNVEQLHFSHSGLYIFVFKI